MKTVNGLALCAGIGGIELGLKLVLGDSYRTVCYVEREAYCAACLVKRMEEGFLDKAPIWDEISEFRGGDWRGFVDVITAGFPCQPFSLAGKRKREADERHIWPDIARIIRECQPALVFLENVHVSAFREPFRDLRAMGFTLPPPYAITAAELGAGHLRRRVFVLAYRSGRELRIQPGGGSRESREGETESEEVSRNATKQPEREPGKETLSFCSGNFSPCVPAIA
ncbi:MAG: DNA cytosine methyltransferase, partial [Candidatus Thorarchaeota archaeon]